MRIPNRGLPGGSVKYVDAYKCLCVDAIASSMGAMHGRGTRRMTGPDRERLSPCVCSTLRIVSKAMTLTSKGRKALEAARPLWARAQDRVLRELGTTAWADAQRRLAHLLRVAVKKRRRIRGQSRVRPRRARRGSL